MRRYYTFTMYIHYQPPLFHLLRGTYLSAPPHSLLFTASCLTGSQDLSSATWPRLCFGAAAAYPPLPLPIAGTLYLTR